MSYLLLTSLMILPVVSGSQAIYAWNLGQYCGDNGHCVNPLLRLVCDRVTDTCRLANDESCGVVGNAVGTSDSCVSGAECDSDTGRCACKSALYSADGNGYCDTTADKFGGACNEMHTCTTPSLVCNHKGVCACEPNSFPDLTTGTCIGITIFCNSADECFDSPSMFSCISNMCACSKGYSGIQGDCAEIMTENVVGKACTADGSECGDQDETHLVCVDSFCACATSAGYHGIQGDICYKAAGQLGGGCFAMESGTKGTCSSDDLVCQQSEDNDDIMICVEGGTPDLVASVLCVITATIASWVATYK